MAKQYVVERTDAAGNVTYAYVHCVEQGGVWRLQSRETWATNIRGGSRLVLPAAQAVMVLVSVSPGDKFRAVPV